MSSASITVRDAEVADFAAIGELTFASYVAAGHIGRDDEYVTELVDVASRAIGPGRLIVAESDGQVAGSTWLLTGDMAQAEIAEAGEFEFRMLGVHPNFQRRGVGRALVHSAIDRARALDSTAVAITTMDSMADAHRLYLSCGFSWCPDRDWSFSSRGLSDPGYGTHPEDEETFRAMVYPLKQE